jgi:eukaryotic-like serine/threonine-protein kinase
MALTPGARLGGYEVTGSLGAGGMGEVYRATDTNLKRDVAIKVLPASLASDAGRLTRFQREAETLAALNHPNIAHIYGIERASAETGADGESPGATTALVMELVEGPTLAERIEQGPIPADEALGIALQIADGLEAAHARGIVHRDLKPANIKLATDGTVKVLDFGIAKALDTRTISGPQAPALTTPAMTEAGIVLGTAQYMSPEQARGKPVDQRADVWAFGCVLYEMLTGQPAFGGEDVTIVLARVLERGADLSALPAELSPAVRQTITLCLQKDPKKRVRDIGDVKLALEGAFETTAARDRSSAPRFYRRGGRPR